MPNIFLFSMLDSTSHPVSLKLNDIEDKIINNDIEKNIPSIVDKNFLLKLRL